MRHFLAALCAALCVFALGQPASLPVAHADPVDLQPLGSAPIPDGPAPNWIVADMDTGEVLAARNEHARTAPASTIKTLLAQVIVDEVGLDTTIVGDAADTQVECNCAGVAPGQTYTARQLLEGLLLASGNDAANTLARMVGGEAAAVDKMNAKAAAIGAVDTHAGSPSGIDAPGMAMWSTPRDLAVIFRNAMTYPDIAAILAMPAATFPAKSGPRTLANQNEMLFRYPGFLGGKTGFTDIARKTYVGAAARDGRRLVIAMTYGLIREGGPTYWDQATTLLDWGFAQGRGASVGVL